MTSNARRAAVLEEVLRASLEGDAQAIARLCTEDVKAWTPDRSITSRDELVDQLGRRERAFSSADAEVVPLDVGGDFARAEWSVTLTQAGSSSARRRSVIEPTGAWGHGDGATVPSSAANRSAHPPTGRHAALAEIAAVQGVAGPPVESSSLPTAAPAMRSPKSHQVGSGRGRRRGFTGKPGFVGLPWGRVGGEGMGEPIW